MTHTLAKFSAEYGNYGSGHNGTVLLEDVRLMQPATGPEIHYLVSYQKRAPEQLFNIPAHHLAAMRNWLVSQPIVGPVAETFTAAEVLRRVEQYYGTDGLRQFIGELEAAYQA